MAIVATKMHAKLRMSMSVPTCSGTAFFDDFAFFAVVFVGFLAILDVSLINFSNHKHLTS